MRIVIDRAVCLQSGQCAYMQPELFGFADDRGPVVRVERPTGQQLEGAREAITNCPSQAIRLEREPGDPRSEPAPERPDDRARSERSEP